MTTATSTRPAGQPSTAPTGQATSRTFLRALGSRSVAPRPLRAAMTAGAALAWALVAIATRAAGGSILTNLFAAVGCLCVWMAAVELSDWLSTRRPRQRVIRPARLLGHQLEGTSA